MLDEFEFQIESLEIIPSRGGRFEVVVNGDLAYSKLATGRHAADGEIVKILKTRYAS